MTTSNPVSRSHSHTPRRIAVVGGGHLGTIHARLVQQLSDAELVSIVEPSLARANELANDFTCEIETDFERFLKTTTADGVVLAAPTTLHHDLGVRLLDRGIHCLIEKPLAPNVSECEQLVAAASRNNCVLQVGHVERFNPVWTALKHRLDDYGPGRGPQFIDATREGPLTFRSMDAGVVLDLMIHDIDLVLSIVDSTVVSVRAIGFKWTGETEDVAQARITFANGTVARFSASRVATSPQRRMRIFGREWYANVDFAERNCTVVNAPIQKDWQSRKYTVDERNQLMHSLFDQVLPKEELEIPDGNPILCELSDFVSAIQEGRSPIVTGEAGLAAVDIAQQVIQTIDSRAPTRHVGVPIYLPTGRKAG